MRQQPSRSRHVAATLALFATLSMFGTANAAAPTTPTISVNPTTLTPYNSGGCYAIAPCFEVRGFTDAGVKVFVITTDAFGKSFTNTTYSAERNDAGAGIAAGEFRLYPNVTGLGTHDATPSTLTFVAYAEDALGNKSANSVPFAVTKIAATAGDTNAPTLTIAGSRYPSMACGTGWCNFSICLMNSALGALPGQSPAGGCTGRYKMAGSAEDLNASSYGVASEIADIVLTVKNASGAMVTTVHALGLRRGTQGFWAADILASDYAVGESYTWSIVASDAAGNTSPAVTGTFTRYPL